MAICYNNIVNSFKNVPVSYEKMFFFKKNLALLQMKMKKIMTELYV